MNAVAARKLGAEDFGLLYQAWTFSTFAFLFIEWGTPNVLTAKVAAQREGAGRFLGSTLAFRLAGGLAAGLVGCAVAVLADYGSRFVLVLSLVMVVATCATLVGACQDTMRGFERAELGAACYVGWQLLSVLVVAPVLLLGGGINGFLVAQIACSVAGCVGVLLLVRLQTRTLEVSVRAARELFRDGTPFLIFGTVLVLQPLIDAAMLSKFVPPPAEDLGWYAVARKLVGVAVFPGSALVSALYPTLCRLRVESLDAYRKTAADALYAAAVLALPLAIGCGVFPGFGVNLLGGKGYAPAEEDLRVLGVYVVLVYLSMPIGSCLTSSGRQRAWTALQFGCVIVSVILDPPLIRWFSLHRGNGGLGVCVASVVSETLMLAGGAALLPPGILAKLPWLKLAAVALSGGAMAIVALWSTGLGTVLQAVAATAAYILCLQLSGGCNLLQARGLVREIRGH